MKPSHESFPFRRHFGVRIFSLVLLQVIFLLALALAAFWQPGWVVGLTLGFILVVLLAGWLVFRSIRGLMGADLQRLMIITERMSKGNLAASFGLPRGKKPQGLIANLLTIRNTFKDGIRAVFQVAQEVDDSASELNKTIVSIQGASGSVDDSIQSSYQEIAGMIQAVMDAAQRTEELLGRLEGIGDKMHQAKARAEEGREILNRTGISIQKIAEAMGGIASFVQTINTIANQTNLLSLNAAIEAAKAGEAGKGFGVVATAVKNLANQSNQATREIEAKIQANLEEVEQGSQVIENMGSSFRFIIEQVMELSTQMGAAAEGAQGHRKSITALLDFIARVEDQSQVGRMKLEGLTAEVTKAQELAKKFLEQSQNLLQSFSRFELDRS